MILHVSGPRLELPTRGGWRVTPVLPDTPLFQAVLTLGDANRRMTGLLPRAAWTDYAERGHLLAVVCADEPRVPAAYVAYRLPRDEVVLTHLVVAKGDQGQGLARLLVKHVSDAHQGRMGIATRCRRDWPAHAMWPHLGSSRAGSDPDEGGTASSPRGCAAGHHVADRS